MSVVLYGISNCDTVKKARTWLAGHGVDYRFHDLRQDGLDQATLQAWAKALGVEALLNKRSTTWRQLSDADKDSCEAKPSSCVDLLLAHPTLIKRPVLLIGGVPTLVGFKAELYSQQFS